MRALISLFCLTLGLLMLSGCSTFESRAKQKASVFAALDAATQARLQAGEILIGDNEDMVYLARGIPDEKQLTTTAAGQTTNWIYNRYWQEYRGEAYGGFQPRVIRDPNTGTSTTYLEPVSRPVYTNRTESIMRITFTEGKVTAIEQPQK